METLQGHARTSTNLVMPSGRRRNVAESSSSGQRGMTSTVRLPVGNAESEMRHVSSRFKCLDSFYSLRNATFTPLHVQRLCAGSHLQLLCPACIDARSDCGSLAVARKGELKIVAQNS